MFSIAVLLIAFRQTMKVGELSLNWVGWLLGMSIGLVVLWIVAERLAKFVPGRLHCNVCGERLKNPEFLRGLRSVEPQTYPFLLMDGTRAEQPVMALCRKCTRRARKHRDDEASGR